MNVIRDRDAWSNGLDVIQTPVKKKHQLGLVLFGLVSLFNGISIFVGY